MKSAKCLAIGFSGWQSGDLIGKFDSPGNLVFRQMVREKSPQSSLIHLVTRFHHNTGQQTLPPVGIIDSDN